jgi:hypothetical protein
MAISLCLHRLTYKFSQLVADQAAYRKRIGKMKVCEKIQQKRLAKAILISNGPESEIKYELQAIKCRGPRQKTEIDIATV